MKKLISLFLSVCMLLPLTSCSLLFKPNKVSYNGNEKNALGDNQSEISLVYCDGTETITVFNNSGNSPIKLKYTAGKVLVGMNEKANGTGTEYINFKGEFAQDWSSNYPETLYAIYEDINYSEKYTSSLIQEEDPYTFNKSGQECHFENFNTKTNDMAKILFSNPQLDVKITMFCELKQSGVYPSDWGGSGPYAETQLWIGNEHQETKNVFLSTDSYTTVSLSTVIKAQQIYANSDNKIELHFYWSNIDGRTNGLIKNIYYTAEIVDTNQT